MDAAVGRDDSHRASIRRVHGTVRKMDFLPDSALTLAEVFKAQGYWTTAFTTNINVAPIFNFQQGFDEFHYLEPSFYFGATDSATKLAVYKGLRAAREKVSSKIWVQNFYQDAEVVDANVEAWLGSKPPEPFFLFVHYMDPHDPYFEIPYNGHGVARVSTPEPAAERAEELHDLYRGDVRYLDAYLQELVERLQRSGVYDRSIIAVTADHGEEFHEHGGWWHGTSLYEEQVHVPLIVKRAQEPAPGRQRSDVSRTPRHRADPGGRGRPAVARDVPGHRPLPGHGERAAPRRGGSGRQPAHLHPRRRLEADHGQPRQSARPGAGGALQPGRRIRRSAPTWRRARAGGSSEMLAQLEQFRARVASHRGRRVGSTTSHAADPRS